MSRLSIFFALIMSFLLQTEASAVIVRTGSNGKVQSINGMPLGNGGSPVVPGATTGNAISTTPQTVPQLPQNINASVTNPGLTDVELNRDPNQGVYDNLADPDTAYGK